MAKTTFNRAFILSFLWTLFIFIISVMPGDDLPPSPFFSFDKIVHVFVYLIEAVLVFSAIQQYKRANVRLIIVVSLILISYGLSIEWLQENWARGRFFDWHDILANSFGIFIGMILFILFRD